MGRILSAALEQQPAERHRCSVIIPSTLGLEILNDVVPIVAASASASASASDDDDYMIIRPTN